jgi:hypothetical protein
MPLLWKYMFIGWTWWKIIQKCQSLQNFKEKATRQMTHLKNHLIKKLYSMGSKCLASDASHMCKK